MKDNKPTPFEIDFDSYILQSEPDKRENGRLWQTAIGLQQADGIIFGSGENKNRTYSL